MKRLCLMTALAMAFLTLAGSFCHAAADADSEAWDRAYELMNAAYDAAYREMYEKWTPEAVLDKYASDRGIADREHFKETAGLVNDLYQAANSMDWRMKYVAPLAAAWDYGAMTGIGVGMFLSDSSVGSFLRESAGYLLAFGEALSEASMREKQSLMAGTDMEIVKQENGYELLRTHGTILSILRETSGQALAETAIAVLEKEQENYTPLNHVKVDYLMGNFDPNDESQLNKAIRGQQYSGWFYGIGERAREWRRMVLCSVYGQASTFTIAGNDVLSMANLSQAIEALQGTVTFSDEDLESIRSEGPTALERAILRNGLGMTDEETDQLRSERRPSVHLSAADYVRNRQKKAEAAGEDTARFDPMIDALQQAWSMVNCMDYSLNNPEAANEYIYYLYDPEGNQVMHFLCPLASPYVDIGTDGSLSMTEAKKGDQDTPDYESRYRVIVDPQGYIVARNQITGGREKTGSVIWYDRTPEGNFLRKTYLTDVKYGDHELLELVLPDGQAVEIVRGKNISRNRNRNGDDSLDEIGFSYFPIGSKSNSGVSVYVDTRTGETKTEKTPRTESKTDENPALQESYTLEGDIVLQDGTPFLDFSELGGVKEIRQIGDQFWVLNKTGYFFVVGMDTYLLSDPIRLNPDAEYLLNEYGLIETETVNENGKWITRTRTAAADGSVRAQFDGLTLRDIRDGYIGNWKNGYYNLLTGEKLRLDQIQGNYNFIYPPQ